MDQNLEQGLLVSDVSLVFPPGETRGPGLQGQPSDWGYRQWSFANHL